MAEFKLGRIRFVWKGTWNNGTSYVVDDVVNNAGQTYICVKTHTSSALFATDFDALPERWHILSDGSRWTGEWLPSTYYEYGDQVSYGGNVYICITPHTSATYEAPTYYGLEEDLGLDGSTASKWNVIAESFNWVGPWTNNTRYRINDFVVYGGTTYVCNTYHISAPTDDIGLEDDQGYWDIFNQGITYLGNWNSASVRYKVNDVVSYGANLWICVTPHISNATFNESVFDIFVSGLQFEDSWNNSTTYQIGDTITYGGYSYIAKTNNINKQPTTNPSDWDVFVTGFSFQSDWLISTDYKVGDVVRYGSYTYVAITDNVGQLPSNPTYWSRLNSGLRWTNNVSTYTDVSGTNLIGTGSSATFDIIRSGTIYTVTSNNFGTGYATNDQIKILGSNIGGISPANDLIITVTGQTGGVIDTISWEGNSVTWKTGTSYILGDVVYFGANSYVCINAHTSSSGNRPDADITATYWNTLTAGSESAVLTTLGDTFYLGPSGATRLPIGTEGQLLRVNNGYPDWEYYGIINNVVYVGPLGVDHPAPINGLTIDNPWKTVRYAAEQIEKGYLNVQAAELLAKNKQFIIKEVYQYVEYTYPGVVDQAKTERDAGIILDSVIFDISHGGNSETTLSTYEYFNEAGTNYVNATVNAQKVQFIAGLNYLVTVAQSVLSNSAPVANYQNLNSVATPAEQIIDTTLTAEPGIGGVISDLVDIVTDALSLGNTTGTKPPIYNNTSINVKTGTYNEVLPIVIPNYTAIVGDELRSTVIQPKPANDMLVKDKPKTIAVLDHISTLIPDLMTNNTITPTSGNTQTQIDTLPAGNIGSVAAVNSVVTSIALIRDILENGIQQVPTFNLPTPTNYNTTLTDTAYASTGNATGATLNYGDGKAQIVQNYQFIQDEIAAWLTVNGGWVGYSAANKIKALRDVRYILDAIQYDITYGGNRQSLIAGRAYYSNGILQISTTALLTDTTGALGRLKTIIEQIATATSVTPTAGNTTSQVTSGTAGSAGSGKFAAERVQNVLNWINNGTADSTVEPYIAWTAAAKQTAFTALQAKRSEVASDAMLWVKKFYQETTFDLDLAERDGGDIVDAISYDMLFGSNFNSLTAGRRYLSDTISNQNLIAELITETSNSIDFIGWKSKQIVSSGAVTQVQTLIDDINSKIKGVVSTTLTNVTTSTNVLTVTSTEGMYVNMPVRFTGLLENITTTATNTTVTTNVITLAATVTSLGIAVNMPIWFTGTVFGNIVQNQKYYVKTASGSQVTVSLTIGGATVPVITASGTMNVIVNKTGGIYENKTYWLNSIDSSTQITITDSYKSGSATVIGNTVGSLTATITAGQMSEVNGTNDYNNNLDIIQGAEILRANKEFLAYEATAYITDTYVATITTTTASNNRFTTSSPHPFIVGDPVVFSGSIISNSGITAGITYYVLNVPTSSTFTLTNSVGSIVEIDITVNGSGSMTMRYSYDEESYLYDMRSYIDALIYDLNFTGNYRSIRAAVEYIHAVDGSLTSDMFYVGNATGLRNCTLSGLVGTLSAPNEFGTRRPTAGAYTSLNPGFGPADEKVWVKTRSHYSQNCTLFGSACTGAKIDSSLHNGGNKSMVKNDYTTILSDGIGVWCTGSESLVELVSVFNYYGYAGYLAELGGKIRATNGNSSYGTYGVIAEGVDSYEVPLYARLDNRANQAQITNVLTDGVDAILCFEYGNAGNGYTNSSPTISGSGFNATAIGDEFRDSAVFESRLIDLNNGEGVGGEDYLTASNVAQGGNTTSITIAATDTQLSTAYIGMRIVLTAGTGAGQYGYVVTYNNGSKIAQVAKDSFTALTATQTTASTDVITVASTATLYVGMPVYFTGTAIGGLSTGTLYWIISANFTSTTFSVSNSFGGSVVPVSDQTASTMNIIAAGWDHVVPGTIIENTLDLTTAYNIETRILYSNPGYTSTARTLPATTTWGSAIFGDNKYVAITSSGTSTAYSSDGINWTSAGALPASTTWADVAYGGGAGAVAVAIVGGLGGTGAVLQAVLGEANTNGDPLADQIKSVTVINGGNGYTTPPTIVFTSGSGSGAVAAATVIDGVIQSVIVSIPGSGYLTTPTVTAATDRVTSIEVTAWGRGYTSPPTVTVSGGGSSNQATGTAVLTNTGVSSITLGNDGGTGYTSTPTVTIVDPLAKFVAIKASGGSTAAYQTVAGLGTAWTVSSTIQPAGTYAALAYGSGVYVSVGGTNSAMSSSDGSTWITRTIPTLGAGTYSAVAYGNGVYVAIATGTNASARSTNGNTWVAGGNLPSSTAWSSIAYGNGRFVAVESGGRSVAYSLDKGVTWIASTPGLPLSQSWSKVAYGQGLFIAISQSATVCATSPDGVTWTSRAMPGSSTNWKGLAFGNINSNPLWVAVSNTSGTVGASIRTGTTPISRTRVVSEQLTEIRMLEPGSGYPKGTVTATTVTTNIITVSDTTNLVDSQPIEFLGCSSGGLDDNVTYYVIGSTIVSNTSFKVSATAGSSTPVTLSTTAGLTGTYKAGPIVTQYDPNKTVTAGIRVRMGDGALGNPSFSDRGTANTTASAVIAGDGYSDLYQPSNFINVSNIYSIPLAGANIQFDGIPGEYFKLVSVTNVLGIPGNYTATFQINPSLTVLNAPENGDLLTTRIKYSQVRLTGHDFLYIGTGNFADTNYPLVDPSTAIQANQTYATGGGRVFFTSTDQDGNFNVGNLFGVQQSTGTATLNASAFNLSGLQSLQLGSVTVGTGSAVINQFSTDPYFTADSDNIVPTQRAIKAYITAQIGGGQASLNVNTLTAGIIYVANNTIQTTSGDQINVKAKMYFTGGIDGAPVALSYYMLR